VALRPFLKSANDCAMSETLAEVPALNPALAREPFAQAFRERGRVHIPDILTRESSIRLLKVLQNETRWTLTLNKGGDFLDIENPPLAERHRLAVAAWERARGGFQYFFDNHRISRNGESYPDPSHYFARLIHFLNTPEFLGVIREITGLEAIAWADAQATLYRPGDFLTQHDDRIGGHNRLAAYVLNLTPVWRPDFGGQLQFFDASGHVAEAYVPTFNALNLFRVPALHAVSQVAPYGGFRYAITGWFHAR
jgi:SM-20-related protein